MMSVMAIVAVIGMVPIRVVVMAMATALIAMSSGSPLVVNLSLYLPSLILSTTTWIWIRTLLTLWSCLIVTLWTLSILALLSMLLVALLALHSLTLPARLSLALMAWCTRPLLAGLMRTLLARDGLTLMDSLALAIVALTVCLMGVTCKLIEVAIKNATSSSSLSSNPHPSVTGRRRPLNILTPEVA